MAKLPRPYSGNENSIASAIAEGRAEDAMYNLVAALDSGAADKAVQIAAARWIEVVGLRPGDAKKLRGGRPALPKEWLSISEMVESEIGEGATYESACRTAVSHFGYKLRHVQECVARYREARATARQYE
jgi:hypothetical protein